MKFFFLILFSWFGYSQNVTYLKFPSDNQLYSRNPVTNIANIQILGSVNQTSGYSTLTLNIYRDNILYNTYNQNLNYSSGTANFEFNTSIVSELKNYSFKLFSNGVLLKESNNIVAGDLYLFQGQSNMRGEDSSSPSSITNFIRSFGKFPIDIQDNRWFINDYVGGIAKSFAINLINDHNIPVGIINGALGGINISSMQRNDINPIDLNTNYGLMLNRFNLAGFTPADVRALVFYQGESNEGNSILSYKNLFYQLKSDWDSDYEPPLYYIFQVRKGCGVNSNSFQFEAQRQLANEISNAKLISTNGVPQGTDGCHFQYNNGYSIFGIRLYNLINYDIYSLTNSSGIFSPTITNLKFKNNSNNEITFELSPLTDSFSLEGDISSNFFFFPPTSTTVTNITLSNNIVTLNLSNALSSDSKLSYLGSSPSIIPIVKNQNNIGLINFRDIAIQPPTLFENTLGNWTYYYNESDLVNPVFGIEKTPSGLGANTNSLNSVVSIHNNPSVISNTALKEGVFVMSKWWNISNSSLPNGWVNLRFFYDEALQTSLTTTATNYKNSQGSSYISPTIYIQTNQFFNPINQITLYGLNIPINKCGENTSVGNYNGNNYTQLNKVQLGNTTGGGQIINVTDRLNSVSDGSIRFDITTGKFQGFNGTTWVNFN